MSVCRTCADTTHTKRYCAPFRCYCGHPDCPAFASYEGLRPINVTCLPRATSTAWGDREEPTWIDQM